MLKMYIGHWVTGKAYISVYKSGDLPINYCKEDKGKVLAYF